jgi:hypothetical protein
MNRDMRHTNVTSSKYPTQPKYFRLTGWAVLTALSLGLLTGGCASTPKGETAVTRNKNYPTAEAIFKEGDVKNKPPTSYPRPIEEVRPAAARALTFVGCKLEEQEDFFIKGKRPQKMGLFVGSGGETVKVFLHPKAANETDVWVDTDLSFVGMAGQQGWNKQVLAELSRILEQPQASAK